MRITKFGHACVRFEHHGTTVVVDPGVFADPAAVAGADAVLVTHEHPDHYLPDHLAAARAPVFTIEAVAAKLRADAPSVPVTVVAPGETFDVGVPVRAVGERHAVIHPEYPRISNSGYVLDLGGTRVYHPGDALTEPGEAVDVLCVPVSAPWLKASEAIEFARSVRAPRNLAIHDRVYSEAGLGMIDTHLNAFLAQEDLSYVRLPDGQDL